MIELILPWPDSRLNPNRSKGTHWGGTSALRQSARTEAWALTKQAARGYVVPAGEIALTVIFVQPDKRRRDIDNLMASQKNANDGIADALGIDDQRFNPIIIRREYGSKPGCVRITIGG